MLQTDLKKFFNLKKDSLRITLVLMYGYDA